VRGWTLSVRFLFIFAACWTAFGFLEPNSLFWILVLAAGVTALHYLLIRLTNHKSPGETFVPLAHAGLAVAAAYTLSAVAGPFLVSGTSLVVLGVLIAVTEHYLSRRLQSS